MRASRGRRAESWGRRFAEGREAPTRAVGPGDKKSKNAEGALPVPRGKTRTQSSCAGGGANVMSGRHPRADAASQAAVTAGAREDSLQHRGTGAWTLRSVPRAMPRGRWKPERSSPEPELSLWPRLGLEPRGTGRVPGVGLSSARGRWTSTVRLSLVYAAGWRDPLPTEASPAGGTRPRRPGGAHLPGGLSVKRTGEDPSRTGGAEVTSRGRWAVTAQVRPTPQGGPWSSDWYLCGVSFLLLASQVGHLVSGDC